MSEPIPVSVIVVSRHRTAALVRCLRGLVQQDHPRFEIIVVADPASVAAVQGMGVSAKLVSFDQANISAARNAGLADAGASVVAFIDDDAVGEPTWLSRLTAPFAEPEVVAATGFVLGRNGISYQWKACQVDALGQDHLLDIAETSLHAGSTELAIKTQGTNCAFRRNALLAVGGFDAAFRFFLDEADVNLRMAPLGLTAVVPDALVHHGFAASDRRRADRVPLSLFDIAASTAIFLRRHAPKTDIGAALADLTTREAARAKHHLVAGRIGTEEETALMASLALGWAQGISQPLPVLEALPQPTAAFTPLSTTGLRAGQIIAGRIWQRDRLHAQAVAAVAVGKIVTVFCLSTTMRAHQMRFQPEGYWLQTGGLFGRSVRQGPRLRLVWFRRRIAQEIARITNLRPTT